MTTVKHSPMFKRVLQDLRKPGNSWQNWIPRLQIHTRHSPISLAGIAVALLLVFTRVALIWHNVIDRPLWLDEAWTGMIANQPTLRDFFLRCASDINAPLSYIVIGLWAQVGGLSNFSLRFPPLLCALVMPLIALTPKRMIGLSARQVWCVLLACWPYTMVYSGEARYYSLYIILGCFNTINFASLINKPELRRSWSWALVSSLFILTHYFSLILVGIQGLVYIGIWRGRALRNWPTALSFVPVVAALATHIQVLAHFAQPGTSWMSPMTADRVAVIIQQAILPLAILGWVGIWVCVGLFREALARKQGVVDPQENSGIDPTRGLWIAVACAAVAFAIAIGVGFIRPVVVSRYLIGFVPALLLGFALMAERFQQTWSLASAYLLIPVIAACMATAVLCPKIVDPLEFQTASEYLMAQSPNRLVFMWDNPMEIVRGKSFDEKALQEVASFFFVRAGKSISVDNVHPETRVDPLILLRRAGVGPKTAVLWIYDLGVPGTSATTFPPQLAQMFPSRVCKNFGDGQFGIIACGVSRKAALKVGAAR